MHALLPPLGFMSLDSSYQCPAATKQRDISSQLSVEMRLLDESWVVLSGGKFAGSRGKSTFHSVYFVHPTSRDRVDAQWILAKKDRRDAKRRHKTSDQPREYSDKSNPDDSPTDTGVYKEEMDQMRCILYSHGGLSVIVLVVTN
jgi:hypothetical protein